MSEKSYLVVGLGNIGPEYATTRHNIGFMILDAWAQASNVVFSTQRYGDLTTIRIKGREFHLLKPSTYMNLSGNAVRYWFGKLDIPLENLVIICDDLNLPFGTVRMRKSGSDGGHNGLKNIEAMLQTRDYARIRVGVGHEFEQGVAKYVQLLIDAGATTKTKMLNQIIKSDSIFLGEGKAILIEEFGKDYGIYFSILSAIARGKTSRSDIENIVGKEIGGYLTKLENEYELISKKQPIFEKSSTKNVRYTIEDNFFTFWFRFIYKYNYMLEIENYDAVKTIINRDYETFSGLMLERYFKRILIESKKYTRIGSWWDRNGENEIDIVAENELDQQALFIEVKRNIKNYNPELLNSKIAAFTRATGEFKNYNVIQKGVSLEDI